MNSCRHNRAEIFLLRMLRRAVVYLEMRQTLFRIGLTTVSFKASWQASQMSVVW